MWSLSFFVLLNCMVRSEARLALSRGLLWLFARLGVFSYSIYLTHELVLTHAVGALATRYHWSPKYRTTLSIFVFTPVCIGLAAVFSRS